MKRRNTLDEACFVNALMSCMMTAWPGLEAS